MLECKDGCPDFRSVTADMCQLFDEVADVLVSGSLPEPMLDDLFLVMLRQHEKMQIFVSGVRASLENGRRALH